MVRAAVMPAPGEPIRVMEFEEPRLEEGSILLRTIYAEVCGTDVHLWHGRLEGVPYPIIPGHVNVGEVERVKGVVTDVNGKEIKQGEVVTFFDVHETCQNCWFCLVAKAATRCPQRRVYGITYSANEGLLGGWSEKIYLKPGVKVIKLPAGISPEELIGGGCGLPTSFHAVERASIKMGDTVVVQGSGPVGLSACIFAQLRGAYRVILIGAPELRLKAGLNRGVDVSINIEKVGIEERIERVKELTEGRGADVVIEASGNSQAVMEGLRMVRDYGTYVVVGQYTDTGDITVNPHGDINRRHLNLLGCWGFEFTHLYRAIKLMERFHHRYRWHEFISRKYPLKEANRALQDVEELKVIKAVLKPAK